MPSLIQALFGRMSTEVDVGRIVESTNVHYKLRVLMKKRISRIATKILAGGEENNKNSEKKNKVLNIDTSKLNLKRNEKERRKA